MHRMDTEEDGHKRGELQVVLVEQEMRKDENKERVREVKNYVG